MLMILVITVCAYFLGSIPAGFIAGKLRGVDIRTVGSGNIGATNAFRILGKVTGAIVLVFDGLKGFAAVTWMPDLVAHLFHPADPAAMPPYYRVLAAAAVVIGHNYTCWLNFKGGKGISTSAGALAGLVPVPFLIILGTWIVVCLLTKYVSVASIVAAVVLPIAAWFTGARGSLFYICLLMGVLAIYRHKGNIQRLMNGTENKIGSRKAVETAEAKS